MQGDIYLDEFSQQSQTEEVQRLPFTRKEEKEETGVRELVNRGRMIWATFQDMSPGVTCSRWT